MGNWMRLQDYLCASWEWGAERKVQGAEGWMLAAWAWESPELRATS